MTNKSKSIVIDTCVARLYDSPLDPVFLAFFKWLKAEGILVISQKLLSEYLGIGNRNLEILLGELSKNADNKRLIKIEKSEFDSFVLDRHYKYTCNSKDYLHARLVFLSPRKKIISQDKKLIDDINKFKKIDGIKPVAISKPIPAFYE